MDAEATSLCMASDLGDGAHLAGPYDLVLVQQEDGDSGRVDQLVDLAAVAAQVGRGVAVL